MGDHTSSTPVLTLRDIHVSYPRGGAEPLEVLGGIDLEVADGEFVAVLGFSGSGKTTLVNVIAGLAKPDRGEVLVRGERCSGPGRDRGVVFQSYSLLPWLTAEENVRLAVDAVHRDRPRAERAQLTAATMRLVGLSHATDRKLAQLSGGMRQRVAVARALATKPDILLMDEPLSALDALTRAKLQDEVERIRAHERRTIVLVTNDVDEALLLADRVALLGRGPGARLERVIEVDLPRPRRREELNGHPDHTALRNEIIATLNAIGGLHASSAATAEAAGRAAPSVRPAWHVVEQATAHDDAHAAELDDGPPAAYVAASHSAITRRYLELFELTKVFPTPSGPLTVVEGVNLLVDRGEFVSVIGHSGCGKSTVLSMAAGLTEVTGGGIVLDGREVTAAGPDKAAVFQAPSLLPWLTARQNVLLGVERVYPLASRHERREIVEYYLARVGLADAMDVPAADLSNGMRQRVGLARAFALSPRLLLLDEPFGMLDSLTRWSLQDVLTEVWQRSKVTTICVTHDVDEAILLADRVVMMTNGPNARIGRVLEVDLPRPRDRVALLEDPHFYAYRAEVLAFLHEFEHGGAADAA